MRNGFLTSRDLVTIPGGQQLHPAAAIAWAKLNAAFKARFGFPLTVTEGYRSYARQVYYRTLYLAGRGWPAGIPGTSKHGLGLAVDISGYGSTETDRFAWLLSNAPKFGWSWAQGRQDNEPWHWVYVGALTITTPTSQRKKDTMQLAHQPNAKGRGRHLFILFNDQFALEFTGDDAANRFAEQIGGLSAPVGPEFFALIHANVAANRKVAL